MFFSLFFGIALILASEKKRKKKEHSRRKRKEAAPKQGYPSQSLVTPPPLAVNPLIRKPYAMAAKRVAQQRRTPTIDLYTLFFLREKELLSFYQDEADPDPVFYLEPNLKGQRLIAREAYRVLFGGRAKYAAK